MFLGYDTFSVKGKTGHVYTFNAAPYPFVDAPNVPAVFLLARMDGEPKGQVAVHFAFEGQTDDLRRELSRHRKPSPGNPLHPNAILWRRVDDAGARLAICNDLRAPKLDISQN